MVRSKKSLKGKCKSKSISGRQNRWSRGGNGKLAEDDAVADFIPFTGTSRPTSQPQEFSLHAEALNTQRHEPARLAHLRLRDARINFVSANPLQPSNMTDPETAMECMSLKEPDSDVGISRVVNDPIQAEKSHAAKDAEGRHQSQERDVQNHFIIDIEGIDSIITGLPTPHVRSPSPTPSSSSEEIILFRGRESNNRRFRRPSTTEPRPSEGSILPTTIDDDVIIRRDGGQLTDPGGLVSNKLGLSGDSNDKGKGLLTASPIPTPIYSRTKLPDSVGVVPLTSKEHYNGSFRSRTSRTIDDEMMDDYIENMREQGLDILEPCNERELGGNESDVWQHQELRVVSDQRSLDINLSHSEFANPNTLCALVEASESTNAVLSRRDRESNQQCLASWSDGTSDKPERVPGASPSNPHIPDLIDGLKANERLASESLDGDADDSDSLDDGMTPADDSVDSGDDNIDLIRRQIDNINDEKIARLLEKQFEFGFDSAELALFDESNGMYDSNTSTTPGRKGQKFQRRGRAAQTIKSDYPSATMLADAYDGFDVMDFERPSLKKKAKGRKGKLPFDVSDPELEASMQSVWENDRVKKKERKEDREQRRALGLLGNNPNKPDLSVKYKEGMGITAIKEEIRLFLIGNNTTLALPPMEKRDRIVVHEIANAFNLKSKSVGAERKRFPVLYRTHRTSVFNENTFNTVERRISRRFFPRMDIKGKGPMPRSSRGFSSSAGGYKDGDVVGGSAPELGVENKGRAMLEKMGWSSGTALGAMNNKGILQPVSHVVKTTKAGLG